MKSKVIDHSNDGEYPKLMAIKESESNGGTVILFEKEGRGTVIFETGIHPLSHTDTDWAMEDFEDFKGTVELCN